MSNNQIAIKAESLGKRYRIGEQVRGYKTIRDSISGAVGNGVRKVGSAFNGTKKEKVKSEIWAIKDISFEIKQGEIVGIIGRNGAGKSTLLKTLARITEPTSGSVDIYGRVGSLLEVGTGFNPELTGRENIFLSGSILGMKNVEIKRHFDEIVEFSEVDKFIDTPVKHYSSGMYLRLAFGVAAHLQPEILLVDEVLAVGDMSFQRKCLGKMGDVAKQGRTVLFVSHNMSAVQELCERGILIENGQIGFDGKVFECIKNYYLLNNANGSENGATSNGAGKKRGPLVLSQLKVNDSLTPTVYSNQEFELSINVSASNIKNPWMFFVIENDLGQALVHVSIYSKEIGVAALDGDYALKINLPALWLAPGLYSVYSKFVVPSIDWSGKAVSERVILEVKGNFDKTGKTLLSPDVEWKLNEK